MKNLLFIIILIFVFVSCCNEPKCYTYGKVLEVYPQHSTRVYVKYVSKCGDTIISSVHHSNTITADNITFYAGDYINGKLKYGPIN